MNITPVAEIAPLIGTAPVVFIASEPGTGVITGITETCAERNLTIHTFLYLTDATDLMGLPYLTEDGTVKTVLPESVQNADVLLFEEVNPEDEDLLNLLQKISETRNLNSSSLPNLKTVIVNLR